MANRLAAGPEQRARSRREALASLLTGSIAEPVAGLAGLYGTVTGGLDKGVRNIEATRNALTYQPRDPSALNAVGEAVAPIANRLAMLKQKTGDFAYDQSGGNPAIATAGYLLPDTLLTLLGARGAKIKGPTLRQMVERSEGPTMGAAQSQVGAIGAWHGSPHDFDRFSMANIGTGEGAQAYGHGLYFAGSKDIANHYRKTLTQDFARVTKDGVGISLDDAKRKLADVAYTSHPDVSRALADEIGSTVSGGLYQGDDIAHFRNFVRKSDWDSTKKDAYLAALDHAADYGVEKPPGALYNVELAPDEADLLDWDAPLSQQPEKVRAALHQAFVERGFPLDESGTPTFFGRDPDGQSLHASLGGINGQKLASERLHKAGIPGIRYLDGGSRAAGDGSRNYVMFDDSLVKIKGKE